MIFQRRFTTLNIDPYSGISWSNRTASKTAGGAVVVAPVDWSQTAVDIIAGKYMRKAGVPSHVQPDLSTGNNGLPDFLIPKKPAPGSTLGAESDARQVFDRMAGFWTYWGWKLGYFGPTQIPYDQWTKKDYRDAIPGSPEWNDAFGSAFAFYDEIRFMLAHQMAAPASPQWFNAGLSWAYGITGDDCGQWCIQFDQLRPGSLEGSEWHRHPAGWGVEPARDPYQRPALSACFIQGVEDNLVESRGILDLMRREALVFKFGGGSGSNWSNVRGKGEPLSGGGVSSGLLSFLKAPDQSAGAIQSGGTTRRAARMLTLDDDHPELLEYIGWKASEEKKVAAIAAGAEVVRREVEMVYRAASDYQNSPNDDQNPTTIQAAKRLKRLKGQAVRMGVPKPILDAAEIAARAGARCPDVPQMDAGFEGVAYNTVQGQNANNSVRTSNKFMERATAGEITLSGVDRTPNWNLYGRVEKRKAQAERRDHPKPTKTVNASETLDAMAYAAWECGCPGWHFDTTFNEWWTCPQSARINATNPCSEYAAADDTACNLGSLNLLAFVRANAAFDVKAFQHAVEIWTTVLDITVTAAAYPSKEIADGSRKYRTLGLGYTNLGAFLMRRGIAYDSNEGRAWAGYLTALMHYTAGIRSARLACELAPFPEYAKNEADVKRVMRNHANYGSRTGNATKYEGLTFKPEPLHHRPGKVAVSEEVRDAVYNAAEALVMFSDRHGLRNAQLTLLAPNGTIGLVLDCDTTGVEPDFALVKWKKLAGGGFFKIVNQSIPCALKALGYTAEDAEQIRLWTVGTGSLPGHVRDSLKSRGVPDTVVDKVNDAVKGAMKITDCFTPFVIGEEEFRRVAADTRKGGVAYLDALGIDRAAVREVSHTVCGHGTVEGCPVLKPEHLAVFDCANKCGKDGTRWLSVESHLDMMASVQPVLSGAISKTVNFPADAIPHDFRAAAVYAWKCGLKAMAGFRDGSKMAQPLNTDSDSDDMQDAETLESVSPKPVAMVKSQRRHMPNRVKGGDRVKFVIQSSAGKSKFYLRCGEYPDGQLGEIFIDCAKEGAALRGIMSGFAMAVSIGLQHSVPLEEYVEALTFTKFEPNGPILGHERLKRCDSIIDAIFRELAITYLKRDDLAHVQPEPSYENAQKEILAAAVAAASIPAALIGQPGPGTYAAVKVATDAVEAREKGYTGNRCRNPRCRAFTLVRAGACEKCDTCGDQSGCA